MNQNYNCVPEFIESATNASIWQHAMTGAALAANLTVQWCYAAPTDVLASLSMPALTNFRVSTDFCYGSYISACVRSHSPPPVLSALDWPPVSSHAPRPCPFSGHSWDIGVSSLLVWAVGAAPSKDTLWTSENGRFAVPGCSWTADHEAPAAELHVVLSLMSTGPVGISDEIGMTNTSLIRRTIAADGTLLKPSKPLTSVDSALAAGATGSTAAAAYNSNNNNSAVAAAATASTNATASFSLRAGPAAAANTRSPPGRPPPPGYVYTTYVSGSADGNGGVPLAWQFVSFKMTAAWAVPAADFYPPLPPGTKVVHRRYHAPPCVNGSSATSCGVAKGGGASAVLELPPSDQSNVTGGTDFAPAIASVWPVCAESGWILMGELDKYVPLSPDRFATAGCTATGVKATVVGSAGGAVAVTMISPAGVVLVRTATLDAGGRGAVTSDAAGVNA